MSNRNRWIAAALVSIATAAGISLARPRHASSTGVAPRFTPAQMLDSNIAF
jgi:hypothetical protein